MRKLFQHIFAKFLKFWSLFTLVIYLKLPETTPEYMVILIIICSFSLYLLGDIEEINSLKP